MFFGRKHQQSDPPPEDPRSAARRRTLERLAQFAAEDAARAAAADAERVDEERHARADGQLEHVDRTNDAQPLNRAELEAEIDAALERLDPGPPPGAG